MTATGINCLFQPIIAYDSAGSVSFGEIRVQEQNPGNKYILTIAVDESFLTNSETVYPVTIDPTTSVTSTKRANLEYLCVYSNGTSYSSSSTSGADLQRGYSFSNGVIGRVVVSVQRNFRKESNQSRACSMRKNESIS